MKFGSKFYTSAMLPKEPEKVAELLQAPYRISYD